MSTAAEQARRTGRAAAPVFEQFVAVRRFQPTLTFDPDGRSILFVTDISGQFNLWRTPVEGGWPEQLTASEDETVRSVTVSPDGETIVFTADRHGDEFHQIYALPGGGGWPERRTDADQVQHFVSQEGWTADGSKLAFAANSRTPSDMEVWIRDSASGEIRSLFGEGMFAMPAGWSPDGSRLLAVDVRSNTDSSVFLLDPETGAADELTPHEGETKFFPGPWAADGSGFYLAADEGREFTGLAFYRLADRAYEWVETPEADVEAIAGSDDGSRLAWLVNEQGWSRLYLRNLETGETTKADLPDASPIFQTALALSPDGSHAALLLSQPRRTQELFVVDTDTGRSRRLTDSMLGGLDESELVAPVLVSYATFDGRDVPAWLYRPPGANGPVPAVLSIHGGPEAQERPVYQALYQYLLSRGIAVLATNIRGSTGYGKSYQRLIHHDWGGGELEDLRHAAEWLREQDWVDSERLAAFGGSFGGYATLMCVTRLPEYWRTAVEFFGPSNLVTFSKAVPPTWRRFMNVWVGDPDTEQDFLLERSPITYVDAVRAPLLVIQGATDPRVVKPESDQMVEQLRGLGREVEYVVFDDEGHGFTKRRNMTEAFRLAADWLEQRLLD